MATVALNKGESISAAWLLTAAVCTYLIAYRFYSRIIAADIFGLDATRSTPAERLDDGRDYVPTNKWIVFGHHFAAIAGPGPLVGPTLAAQFGFLPGALWILVGVVLGGAVQDFVILCASIRRDGKSLGQMAKEEIGTVAGATALVSILGIMIILISVLALVVVNALRDSPWGTVTIGLSIPIAMLMGIYLRWIRPGRVLEATAGGLVLLFLSLYAGKWVSESATWAPVFTLSGVTLSLSIMVYGFFASVLPVWMLLAPRDYLSAFVKIGVVLALILFRSTLNIFSIIGFIMLMGLVTKNAILLVDFANRARRDGVERTEALLLAARVRLRPILMTTLAMIFGMVPLAFALTEGSEQRAPMGQAVIGGIITSSILTLVVVPVIYTWLDDLAQWGRRRFGSTAAEDEPDATAPVPGTAAGKNESL